MIKSRFSTFAALFAVSFAVSTASAEEAAKQAKPIPPQVLKKYDVNHDGKLDETELAAWKADKKAAHEKKNAEHSHSSEKKATETK
jgi:hypothetical protein